MKRIALVLGILGMMLFGCAYTEEMPSDEGSSLAVEPAVESTAEAAIYCEGAGGTCRKSRCRSNEVSDWDLECGTDAQCCVPVQQADVAARCSSVGGTCRKSRCRENERSDPDLQCGTDAGCCVPTP